MPEPTDIDRLADMWASSKQAREDIETRYPGLAWIIERVIDPDLRAAQFIAQRSGDWVVGIPERAREAVNVFCHGEQAYAEHEHYCMLREQLTWELIEHCSIPRYHEDGTENWDLAYCPTCGAEGLYGPNSPDHARHQADALLPLIRENIAKAELRADARARVDEIKQRERHKLTTNTLRSYAEARSKSTSEAVRLTAEGVLQILDREATDGTR